MLFEGANMIQVVEFGNWVQIVAFTIIQWVLQCSSGSTLMGNGARTSGGVHEGNASGVNHCELCVL